MILTLHTETVLNSAHKLEGYEGACKNTHGHSWLIEMWFRGESSNLDNVGILVDFGIAKELHNLLDHKYINDVIGMNPTAENLTKWICDWLFGKVNENNYKSIIEVKVRVHESVVGKATWCEGGDW